MVSKMLTFFAVASFTGWILLFIGISSRRELRRRIEQEHTRTTGRIVDHVLRTPPTSNNSSRAYPVPVIEFSAEGQSYRLVYENRLDPDSFPKGETVDVLYDVSDPTHFHLDADPVFCSCGKAAIKFSLIWILASAALTFLLATVVGGFRPDLSHIHHFFQSWRLWR